MRPDYSPGIVMIIDRYYPLWGGTENQLRQLIPHLLAKGCRVFILTRKWDRTLPPAEIIDGIEVYRVGIPGESKFASLVYSFGLFFKLLSKRHSFNIIHSNGAAALAILGVLFAKLFGKKNIARISSSGKVAELSGGRLGSLSMLLLRRSNAIISLSEAITEELLHENINPDIIFPISNGVNCDTYKKYSDDKRESWRTSRNLPPDAILIIFASLFKIGKGHEVLLEAWSEVEKQHKNAWLILLGGGKYQDRTTSKKIPDLARSLGLHRVLFEGETYNTAQFTGIANICAFPSEGEGCPNTLLEGMASQLAPLAFDTYGVRDLIEQNHTGILVPLTDRRLFAQQLIALISSPEKCNKLGMEARISARKKHSFEVIAEKYRNLYSQLV